MSVTRNIAINLIISAILQNFDQCVFIISNQSLQTNQNHENVDRNLSVIDFNMPNTQKSIDNITMYLFDDLSHFKQIRPSDRCLNYIIHHTDSAQTLNSIENLMRFDNNSRYNTRKYLIFVDNDTVIDAIFSLNFIRSIPNLIVAEMHLMSKNIPSNKKNTKNFEVIFYYQQNIGRNVTVLDKWYIDGDTLTKQNDIVDFYPEKIANGADGSEFRVGAGYMIPYTDPFNKTGLYWDFLRLYVKKHNLTLVTPLTRTFVDDAFAMIWNHSLDFICSMFRVHSNRYRVGDFMTPPFMMRMGILAPKPEVANGWFTYINVFTPLVWLLILVKITLISIFFVLSRQIDTEQKLTWFQVIGWLLWQPVVFRGACGRHFTSVHLRLGCLVMALSAILLPAFYCTKLSSNVIFPQYEKKIDTMLDLAQSDVIILTDDIHTMGPIAHDPNLIRRRLGKRFILEDESKLMKKHIPNKKYAYFAYKMGKVFNIDRFQTLNVLKTHRLISEVAYEVYTTPFLTIGSPYLESINSLMLRSIQYGLVEYWVARALLFDRYTNMTFPLDYEKIQASHQATPLNLSQIVGSLMIFAIGISLSLITFGIEIVWFKYGPFPKQITRFCQKFDRS